MFSIIKNILYKVYAGWYDLKMTFIDKWIFEIYPNVSVENRAYVKMRKPFKVNLIRSRQVADLLEHLGEVKSYREYGERGAVC